MPFVLLTGEKWWGDIFGLEVVNRYFQNSGILSMSKHSLVIVLSCTWSTVVGIMDMRLACKCPGDDSRGGGEAKPLNLVISSRLYDEACCLARHHHNYRAGKIDGEAPARRRRAALQNITPDGLLLLLRLFILLGELQGIISSRKRKKGSQHLSSTHIRFQDFPFDIFPCFQNIA